MFERSIRLFARSSAGLTNLRAGTPSLSFPDFDVYRRSVKRVLIVRCNQRLGNTLLATPAVEFVHRAFPQAEIHFLAHRNTQTLLHELGVERIHQCTQRELLIPCRLASLLRALRAEHYDVVIDGGFGARIDGLMSALCPCSCRIGAERSGKTHRYHLSVPIPPKRSHRELRWDYLAKQIGLEFDSPRMQMNFTASEMKFAKDWFADRALDSSAKPVVMVFPAGRSRKGKRWPLEHYMATARMLVDAGAEVLIALGPDERSIRDDIHALAPKSAHFVELKSFRHVAAILSRCRLYVGADTGLMHAASALRVPVLAVFMKGNWERWGPLPDRGAVFADASDRTPEELAQEACAMLFPPQRVGWPVATSPLVHVTPVSAIFPSDL